MSLACRWVELDAESLVRHKACIAQTVLAHMTSLEAPVGPPGLGRTGMTGGDGASEFIARLAMEETAEPCDLEHALYVRARMSDADLSAVGPDSVLGMN